MKRLSEEERRRHNKVIIDQTRQQVRVINTNSTWRLDVISCAHDQGIAFRTRRLMSREISRREKTQPETTLEQQLGKPGEFVDQFIESQKSQGLQPRSIPPGWCAAALLLGGPLAVVSIFNLVLFMLVGSGSIPLAFLIPTTIALVACPITYTVLEGVRSDSRKHAAAAGWVSGLALLTFCLSVVWPSTKETSGIWIAAPLATGLALVLAGLFGVFCGRRRGKRRPLPQWKTEAKLLLAEVSVMTNEQIQDTVDEACAGFDSTDRSSTDTDGADINDVRGTPLDLALEHWPTPEENEALKNQTLSQQIATAAPMPGFDPDDRAANIAVALTVLVPHALVLAPSIGGRDGLGYAMPGLAFSGFALLSFMWWPRSSD